MGLEGIWGLARRKALQVSTWIGNLKLYSWRLFKKRFNVVRLGEKIGLTFMPDLYLVKLH